MPREPMTEKTATPEADRALDQSLRQALEPEATTVDRLVARALAPPPVRAARAGSPTRFWQLAGGLIVAFLVAVALPIFGPRSTVPEDTAPGLTESQGLSASSALVRISNESGPVTVTTSASKVVFLTPER